MLAPRGHDPFYTTLLSYRRWGVPINRNNCLQNHFHRSAVFGCVVGRIKTIPTDIETRHYNSAATAAQHAISSLATSSKSLLTSLPSGLIPSISIFTHSSTNHRQYLSLHAQMITTIISSLSFNSQPYPQLLIFFFILCQLYAIHQAHHLHFSSFHLLYISTSIAHGSLPYNITLTCKL